MNLDKGEQMKYLGFAALVALLIVVLVMVDRHKGKQEKNAAPELPAELVDALKGFNLGTPSAQLALRVESQRIALLAALLEKTKQDHFHGVEVGRAITAMAKDLCHTEERCRSNQRLTVIPANFDRSETAEEGLQRFIRGAHFPPAS